MVRRKLIWQKSAQKDRKEIFKYWNNKNKSNQYSKKLNSLFTEKTKTLKEFPYSGSKTNLENIRVLVIENYLVLYEILNSEILILRIFDGRRNPENFTK